jgi:hypothetical protein
MVRLSSGLLAEETRSPHNRWSIGRHLRDNAARAIVYALNPSTRSAGIHVVDVFVTLERCVVDRGCSVTATVESSSQPLPQDQKMHRVTCCISRHTPTSEGLLCTKPNRKTV